MQESVSYTHLNNQGGTDGTTSQQYWTQFVDAGAEEAYIEGGLVKINRQYAVLKDDWNKAVSDSDGTPTVSYTHLDVYKRQQSFLYRQNY